MKIPTLLGLLLLAVTIALGLYLYYLSQSQAQQLPISSTPKDIRVVNATSTQATVTWQTDQPTIGQIIYSEGNSLNLSQADDRDSPAVTPRLTHFVTLKKLQSQTPYQFRIKSNATAASGSPSTFTTLPTTPQMGELDLYQPIRGTILSTQNGEVTPVDESLVHLKLGGAAPLATFTTAAGNFILPIANLYRESSNQLVDLSQPTEAVLEVIRGEQRSQVQILIPLGKRNLPPLTLGQDVDLRTTLSSPSAKQAVASQFDLNSDGKINSLDLSIVLQNFGKSPKEKKADLNSDGVVDLRDANLIKQALQ